MESEGDFLKKGIKSESDFLKKGIIVAVKKSRHENL